MKGGKRYNEQTVLAALPDTEWSLSYPGFYPCATCTCHRGIIAEMTYTEREGLSIARKLHGDIWEVRTAYNTNIYHLLFTLVGSHSHVLLAWECFQKKTQKAPPAKISLAEARLNDWLERGTHKTRT